jgi:hypothetical protein
MGSMATGTSSYDAEVDALEASIQHLLAKAATAMGISAPH